MFNSASLRPKLKLGQTFVSCNIYLSPTNQRINTVVIFLEVIKHCIQYLFLLKLAMRSDMGYLSEFNVTYALLRFKFLKTEILSLSINFICLKPNDDQDGSSLGFKQINPMMFHLGFSTPPVTDNLNVKFYVCVTVVCSLVFALNTSGKVTFCSMILRIAVRYLGVI